MLGPRDRSAPRATHCHSAGIRAPRANTACDERNQGTRSQRASSLNPFIASHAPSVCVGARHASPLRRCAITVVPRKPGGRPRQRPEGSPKRRPITLASRKRGARRFLEAGGFAFRPGDSRLHRTPWHRPPGQVCSALQVQVSPARSRARLPSSASPPAQNDIPSHSLNRHPLTRPPPRTPRSCRTLSWESGPLEPAVLSGTRSVARAAWRAVEGRGGKGSCPRRSPLCHP